MLTLNEKRLVADALNGTFLEEPHLEMMANGGLESELLDACRLNGLDEKWQVQRKELLQKINSMRPEDRRQLCQTIAAIWERCDENFDKDLEALTL
jgi:hypothetical protein